MFAVIAADGNELIQNALLLIPLTSPIPLHQHRQKLVACHHTYVPHALLPPARAGSILNEATPNLPGTFQARQCAVASRFPRYIGHPSRSKRTCTRRYPYRTRVSQISLILSLRSACSPRLDL